MSFCQDCGASINKHTARIIKVKNNKFVVCGNCGSDDIKEKDPLSEVDNND